MMTIQKNIKPSLLKNLRYMNDSFLEFKDWVCGLSTINIIICIYIWKKNGYRLPSY
jgi:hypothetical protein